MQQGTAVRLGPGYKGASLHAGLRDSLVCLLFDPRGGHCTNPPIGSLVHDMAFVCGRKYF
jgi:hypothetical protein